MTIQINAKAIAASKAAGFHAARIEDGKLVAEYFAVADYLCVLRPDGCGYICIGPDELNYTQDLIYDVAGVGQAIRHFSSVKNFTIKAMRDILSREERAVRAA